MNQTTQVMLKWVFVVITTVVLGSLAAGGIVTGWKYYRESRAAEENELEKEAYQRLIDNVKISVKYDSSRCPSSPYKQLLVVEIDNNTDRTIAYTKFRIDSHQPNYSNSLYIGGLGPSFGTDRIIPSNERWFTCMSSELFGQNYALQYPVSTIWSIWEKSIHFK